MEHSGGYRVGNQLIEITGLQHAGNPLAEGQKTAFSFVHMVSGIGMLPLNPIFPSRSIGCSSESGSAAENHDCPTSFIAASVRDCTCNFS